MRNIATLLITLLLAATAAAQAPEPATARALASHDSSMDRSFEEAIKDIDDLRWYFKAGDVASIDKVLFTSKPRRDRNPTGQGAGNPLIIPAYVFAPKS